VAVGVVLLALSGCSSGSSAGPRAGNSATTAAPPGAPGHAPSSHGTVPTSAAQQAAVQRFAGLGRPIYCGGRRGRLVALTFDDGPGQYTHVALRELRRAGARATFFLVGTSVARYPRAAGILPALRRRSLRSVSVPELLAADPPSAGQLAAGRRGCGASEQTAGSGA
jgi:hypothetical protein